MTPHERIDERAKMLLEEWHGIQLPRASERWRRLARLTFRLEMEAVLRSENEHAHDEIRAEYAGLLPEE